MSMKRRIKIPFCPKCGQKESVSIFSDYFEIWKCDSCNIKFDFTELPKGSKRLPDLPGTLIPPRISRSFPILDPPRKIFFEQDMNKVRLTADIKSFKAFFNEHELQSKLSISLQKSTSGQIGRINLDKGDIDSIKF